ncbi:MAG: hypothetical protein HUU22_05330 [Phycisphaerae bacterium]|nr:hypothetical protein [Phycisphaerae bacterium]
MNEPSASWQLHALIMGLAPLLIASASCGPKKSPDPMQEFIARTDRQPPEGQPANWPEVKRLMARRAPTVGETAPDFTLTTRDGRTTITRSKFHPDRPLVLIFGSFT